MCLTGTRASTRSCASAPSWRSPSPASRRRAPSRRRGPQPAPRNHGAPALWRSAVAADPPGRGVRLSGPPWRQTPSRGARWLSRPAPTSTRRDPASEDALGDLGCGFRASACSRQTPWPKCSARQAGPASQRWHPRACLRRDRSVTFVHLRKSRHSRRQPLGHLRVRPVFARRDGVNRAETRSLTGGGGQSGDRGAAGAARTDLNRR